MKTTVIELGPPSAGSEWAILRGGDFDGFILTIERDRPVYFAPVKGTPYQRQRDIDPRGLVVYVAA